jgi:hypothetical protein
LLIGEFKSAFIWIRFIKSFVVKIPIALWLSSIMIIESLLLSFINLIAWIVEVFSYVVVALYCKIKAPIVCFFIKIFGSILFMISE